MQVVSISSLKGGVGKTSVTTGLASAALAAGIPTLVVDLDPHADATTALGVQPSDKLDIGRMLKNPRKANIAGNVVPSGWVSRVAVNGSGPAVLDVAVGSAYTGIYDRPDLGKRDLRRLSAVLAGTNAYELILVDCPPSLNGLTRMAWSASNKVALVAEPGLFSVAGTERTMRAIQLFRQEFAPNLSPAGIVANRVRSGSSEHAFRLAEAVNHRLSGLAPLFHDFLHYMISTVEPPPTGSLMSSGSKKRACMIAQARSAWPAPPARLAT